jgi:hypothetical protein
MSDDPVDTSTAESGEVAPMPDDNEIFNANLRDSDGEESGYLIKWKTSIGAYIMADEDSHVSLDAYM